MTPRPGTPGGTAHADRVGHPLVVLQSFRSPSSSSNPYLSQLVQSLPVDVMVSTFSWPQALLGRYDVLHLQWPELLVRGRDRPRTLARLGLFALLVVLLRLRRTAVVRTVHNLRPHDDGGMLERWLLHRMDRRTRWWVTLNDETPLDPAHRRSTILHGHYREWYAAFELPTPTAGRLLYFGLVRRYKGVERLVDSFSRLTDADLTLRIVGRPDPPALGERIDASIGKDARISAQWSYVSDDQLAREIGQAALVVLPYTEIHNSGSMLLALSLDRRVLVPDAPTTRALQHEVGGNWVTLYQPPLEPHHLSTALAVTVDRPSGSRPDLSHREWSQLGEQFRSVYFAADAAARAGRRRYSA